ncbi:MAG TPA: hypothetical protein VEQ58_22950 [Polyangiaceae bacterium]|nr:hypothetical protein [Polyangiaceae bacterium]
MGNRHHNKKLRIAVKRAMAVTGESYQRALSRLREEQPAAREVDLIPIHYFGVPMTLATFELFEELSCVATSVHHLPKPFPRSPLFALARPRNVS